MSKHMAGSSMLIKPTYSKNNETSPSDGMGITVMFSEYDAFLECIREIGRGTRKISASSFINWVKNKY